MDVPVSKHPPLAPFEAIQDSSASVLLDSAILQDRGGGPGKEGGAEVTHSAGHFFLLAITP